ncbi:MAG TPA: SBBP repeat-containing protein [Blastocatellia bacterium]|nr:SBBP repeat-containing protein [Blastocatellia bacterium]
MKSRTSTIGMKIALLGLLSQTAFPGLATPQVVPHYSAAKLPATSSVLPSPGKKENTFANLPLRFEANFGQLDPEVKFLARNAGYTVYLTAAEALFMPGQMKTGQHTKALKMRFPGAATPASIVGLEQLPGQSNYFTGAPATWRTGVPGFAKVKYAGLYPGVDLIYYSNGRELEYDFQLAAGTNPSTIRLQFSGAEHLRLNAAGDLLIRMSGGELRQHKPVAYQVQNGVRREVASHFVLRGRSQVGFVVAEHDANLPLVIDPSISYATYLGGSDVDEGHAIAANWTGIYIAGHTGSSDFPTTSGVAQRNLCCARSVDLQDAFVVKLSPDGTQLIYATYLGGTETEQTAGIAVDDVGNAYVTGKTESTNFPTTMNAYERTVSGSFDAFVTKLSSTGTLAYSTYLGSSAEDEGNAIATDGVNAYVTGAVAPLGGGTKPFPVKPNPGAIQTNDTGHVDAFVTKINTTTSGISSLVYSTYLGGDLEDRGTGIALSSDGTYAVVTGFSQTPRSGQIKFPVTATTAYQTTGAGNRDAFLTKIRFTDNLGELVYSTLLGGASWDAAEGVALDTNGNAYLVGRTSSTNFPVKSAFSQGNAYHGSQDAFVAKINPNASKSASLVYSSYLGGTGIDWAMGVAVDAAGQAYVAGQSQSTSGFPAVGGGTAALNGPSDAFLTIVGASGSALAYSILFGGAADDQATGVAWNAFGIAVTGFTTSVNFTVTPGALQGTSRGGNEVFLVRFQ